MKSRLLIIGIILIGFVVMLSISSAYASGGRVDYYNLQIDKTEYLPGETVTITVEAAKYDLPVDELSIRILDVSNGIDEKKIVFEKTKNPTSIFTDFQYVTPEFITPWTPYRYLVLLDTSYGVEGQFFFTKENASKIILSDFKISDSAVKQGDELNLEIKALDGLGNPIPSITVSASAKIPTQSYCYEEKNIHQEFGEMDNSGVRKLSHIIHLLSKPGIYDLKISAHSYYPGYVTAFTTNSLKILETAERPVPYTVFGIYNHDFGFGFPTENPINITAKTVYNQCGNILSGVNVKAELKKYDFATGQWIQTLETQNTVSDENGEFSFFFEPLGLQPGSFSVLLTSTDDKTESERGIQFPSNIKDYVVFAERENFTISVDAGYSIPKDLIFDKENKKITIDIDTSDSLKQVSILVPHELLNGKYTVFENGVEQNLVDYGRYSEINGYSEFRPWIDSDHTRVEIVGTTVIPEFQSVAVIVLIASILPIILISKLKKYTFLHN